MTAPGAVPAALRRIAVVGAECVGKTTLCQALAHILPALWVPEYLREFCDRAGRTPRPEEQRGILHTQIENEARMGQSAAAQGLSWLLCDSAPIVTALYSRMLFDDATLMAPALQHHRQYWATLLLEPDLSWFADGIQRDGPGVRADFHTLLAMQLQLQAIPHHRVHGQGVHRVDRAVLALRALAPQ